MWNENIRTGDDPEAHTRVERQHGRVLLLSLVVTFEQNFPLL